MTKIDLVGGATGREICAGWRSCMESKSALKMMGSLSRATICRSREQHVVIEPPTAKGGKMLV